MNNKKDTCGCVCNFDKLGDNSDSISSHTHIQGSKWLFSQTQK